MPRSLPAICLALSFLVAASAPAQDPLSSPADPAPWNSTVLAAIKIMPSRGGYKANALAMQNLGASIRVDQNQLLLQPSLAHPSFCSTATYLVFLEVIRQWSRSESEPLPPKVLDSLLARRQPDGVGVWGCWNANGPGTARLFFLLGLGRNFTDIEQARPGDFLKVFWNEHIGSLERGHSVVYLGRERDPSGAEFISYWSSNQPDGYGYARIPRSRIKRMLFSRLENPAALRQGKSVSLQDRYLADMLKRPGTPEEMLKMTGASP